MTNSMESGSAAFIAMLNQAKQVEKKYGKVRKSGVTKEWRLLSEADARSLHRTRKTEYWNKCSDSIARGDYGDSALTPAERRTLSRITGNGRVRSRPPMREFSSLASNPHARAIFYDEAYRLLKPIHAASETTMYFATLVDRRWLLPVTAKSLNLLSMIRRTVDALRTVGWDGIMFLEVQAVTNLRAGRFLAHFHGFMWRSGRQGTKACEVRKLFNARFGGIGKAAGLTLRLMPRRFPNALPTRFFYATKLPATGKSCVVPYKDGCAFLADVTGRMKVAHPRNYSDRDALKILRFLSQHEVDRTVVAVGKEATRVRKGASKALTMAVTGGRGLGYRADPLPKQACAVLTKLLRD